MGNGAGDMARTEPALRRVTQPGGRVRAAWKLPRRGPPERDRVSGYFKFSERGTTLATEAKAGVTTFMVMAYILLREPEHPATAGHQCPGGSAATALVAGVMTIAMGIIANAPIALAAGLGINGAVAFGLVLTSA